MSSFLQGFTRLYALATSLIIRTLSFYLFIIYLFIYLSIFFFFIYFFFIYFFLLFFIFLFFFFFFDKDSQLLNNDKSIW